jgi:hypothetical protein
MITGFKLQSVSVNSIIEMIPTVKLFCEGMKLHGSTGVIFFKCNCGMFL